MRGIACEEERKGEERGGEKGGGKGGKLSAAVVHLEGFDSLPAVVRHIQVLGVLGFQLRFKYIGLHALPRSYRSSDSPYSYSLSEDTTPSPIHSTIQTTAQCVLRIL